MEQSNTASKKLKILYLINYFGLGADRWISSGYRDAFTDMGHEFHYVNFSDDLREAIETVCPDILMLVPSELVRNPANWPAIREARRRGAKVFVGVDQTAVGDPEKLAFYRDADIADVYYGENEEEWMQDFVRASGKKYVTIPNAANSKYHFPAPAVEKYRCDIAFLGAMMPLKRTAFKKLLIPLTKRYHVRIYGPGWTFKDKALKAAAALFRKAGIRSASAWFTAQRVSVPPEEERELYSSAKASVNIHERGPETKNHVFLNERTFKIPACGGFEICDHNLALRRHFTESEVVMADDDEDWFKKIDYYLHHDGERSRIREAGARRALRDHTYHQRAKRILELAGFNT
jgi:spore maturation protein CgeB